MTEVGATIEVGGRAKAYRPLPASERWAALEAGVEAFEAGSFFEAHELLEPAWMGTDDLAERALYQGLIKLAAAYVHAVRGNPAGMRKNLRGARAWLSDADAGRADARGLDLPRLLVAVDARLEGLAREPDRARIDPPRLRQETLP